MAENLPAAPPATSNLDSSTTPASSPAVEKSPVAGQEVEVEVPAAAPGESSPAPPGEGPPVADSSPPPQVAVEKTVRHEPPIASEQKSESFPRRRTATSQKPTKSASSRRRGKTDLSERKVHKVKTPVEDDRPPVIVLPPED
jgi:hypothetical protein